MIEFKNVSYSYAFQDEPAIKDISFNVKAGEIVLCSGASGCGKSTLMRLANGLCPHYFKGTLEGEVIINGQNTKETPIYKLSQTIGTLFQDPEQQFFALNVEDELAFSHEWQGESVEQIKEKIERVEKEFGLENLLASSIHDLSEGQKQKVGLASILSQDPQVLILDEPTANLDPESTEQLAKKLMELKKQGKAILIVDHRLYWLEGVADRVIIMNGGKIEREGDFSILHDECMREEFGLRKAKVADIRSSLQDVTESAEDICLEVKNLFFAHKKGEMIFSNDAFAIPNGITALIGDNGTGKTTLARIITGLNKASNAEFFLEGKKIVRDELLLHIGIVLQNADYQLQMRTVLEEVSTCLYLAQDKKTKQKRKNFEQKAEEILQLFALEKLLARHPQSLSGGEKQRLVIACAFAKNPKMLILDEPTSGLDGKNMQRIAKALEILVEKGTCIIVITHDLELMDISCSHALRLPLRKKEQKIQGH